MKRALPEKWIGRPAEEQDLGKAARLALENRLGAVVLLLPMAGAKSEQEVECVHELRVWARRSAAALDLYEDFLPEARFAWMNKRLKRIQRAANDARNLDVLIERLERRASSRDEKLWAKTLQEERTRAQKALVETHQKLAKGRRFERKVEELLDRVRFRDEFRANDSPIDFGTWARMRLRPMVETFFRAFALEGKDEQEFHQLRVLGKKLRYAMELLAEAFPDEFRSILYPTIKEVQDRLGELNDLATARAWLSKKLESSDHPNETAAWRRLLAKEEARVARARKTFKSWCSPEMLEALRKGFAAALSPSTKSKKARTRAATNGKPGAKLKTKSADVTRKRPVRAASRK